jgi:hypothetical protein
MPAVDDQDGQSQGGQTKLEVMGPAQGKVRPYPGERLNGSNWNAFEFGFKAYLMGQGFQDVLESEELEKSIKNACFGILIGALESGQYIHV